MKKETKFTYIDINDGYTFEVHDNEGYLGSISKEVKEYIEELEQQLPKFQEDLKKNSDWEKVKQENKELRDALIAIQNECDSQNSTHENVWRIAEQALKK